jgi:hypothetical protein
MTGSAGTPFAILGSGAASAGVSSWWSMWSGDREPQLRIQYETCLGVSKGTIGVLFHIYTKEASRNRVFFSDPDFVSFKLVDEVVYGFIGGRVNE